MRKSTLIFLLLLFAYGAQSNPVGKGKALQLANNFYYAKAESNFSKESLTPEFIAEKSYQNTLCFYIIKYTKQGYVIVSADDAFSPVLGFSDEDNLSLNNIPSEMEWWLEMRANEMIASKKFNTTSDKATQKIWNSYEDANTLKKTAKNVSVDPLVTSKWDQGAGYNYHCPVAASGPGGKCYAGCVATAMAQIMYYYKYPEHGYSSHSYYDPYYSTISADFGNTTYAWDSMTNTITSLSRNAISTLIYQCGVAVDMDYSPTESGAFSENVKAAIQSYFNYSVRCKYLLKDDYTDAKWNQMLMDNLDNGQPLLYSGSGNAGGHAFVCDGYKDSCYFHFNWGWSGSGNGYFYTSNLNSGNGDFSSSQSALFNMAPYDYQFCNKQKSYTKNVYAFGDGSEYSYYWNNTDCDWLITPEDSSVITLKFLSFDTELDHDILTIYDGKDASAPVLGTFSGNTLPGNITSTGSALYLTFKTDEANQYQGWQLSYSTLSSGVEESSAAQNMFSAFPNPAGNTLQVSLNSPLNNDAEISLCNLLGEKVLSEKLSANEGQKTIDLSNVSNGVYLVTLTANNIKSFSKLIVAK